MQRAASLLMAPPLLWPSCAQYDTDADIGLRVGLRPMGAVQDANMLRVGCTVSSFATWAAKVLALGYAVGR